MRPIDNRPATYLSCAVMTPLRLHRRPGELLFAAALCVLLLSACSTLPVARPAVTAVTPSVARPAAAGARNAYVLLSGGGTPLSNNYSQYLQAQAMADFFQRRYPADSVWVFFGVGNRTGAPATLADVHQQVRRDGLLLDWWVPGVLPNNRPATRESFLGTLRQEILPVVREGGTLFLFIGDHGELSKGDTPESAVTMWQLQQVTTGRSGWRTNPAQLLPVSDLREVLQEGLGRGRLVFCATCCHPGGFHHLAVPRDMGANPLWFVDGSGGADAMPMPEPLRMAGFTATDENSLASGCVTDPDPERWAGYERFIPEALLGIDLFTRAPRRAGLDSFAAAHEAATLVDFTIDKPYGTSDQFLERWAELIETKLVNASNLTPAARQWAALYTDVVNGADPGRADPGLAARQARFRRFTDALVRQSPTLEKLLRSGTRKELEDARGPAASRPGRPTGVSQRPAAGTSEVGKLWKDVVRPAWKAAVLAGPVAGLPAAAVPFEKRLLQLEDQGRDLLFTPGRQSGLLNETYWQSSLANPQTTDRARAEAVTRHAVERRRRIAEWAKDSPDEKVREAAVKLAPPVRRPPPAATPGGAPGRPAPPGGVSAGFGGSTRFRATAADRVLFYRRVLGAWAFLLAANERPALDDLAALIELENTPLPPAARS
jgi:hypothetical protein